MNPTGEQLAYRMYREWCRERGLPVGEFMTWRKINRQISNMQLGPWNE